MSRRCRRSSGRMPGDHRRQTTVRLIAVQHPLRVPPSAPARVVVLASGTGSLLQSLLDAAVGDYPARIVAVGVDRDCRAVEIAAGGRRSPPYCVRLGDHPDRAAWDAAIADATARAPPGPRRLGRFHENPWPGVSFALRRPGDQHPPRAAAVVPRRARGAGRAGLRRQGHRLHGAPGRRRHRHRPDPGPAGGPGARRRRRSHPARTHQGRRAATAGGRARRDGDRAA